MLHVRSVLLVAIFVVVAGCSGPGVAGKPSATATASPIPQPTMIPTPVEISQVPLTIAQAWGNVQIASYPVTMGDRLFQPGGGYGEDTVTDDDQVCGVIKPASPNFDHPLQNVQSLVMFHLHTGAITPLQTLPPGYQASSCAVTGAWVIWTQSYGYTLESLQAHWKIMAVNRQTHEVRLLDQSILPNGQPAPQTTIPTPSASHGLAGWTTFADNQAHSAAVLYDFASGHKTLLATGTSFPLLSWPWVSWGDSTQRGIVFKNLETQQQTLLSDHPTTTAFNGTAFVAANAGYTSITLYPSATPDHLSTAYIVAKSINGDFVEYPTVNDRLVTWNSNYSLFAFDRKLQRLVQFPGAITGSPFPLISSHYMIWGQKDTKGHLLMYVLDTNTLP